MADTHKAGWGDDSFAAGAGAGAATTSKAAGGAWAGGSLASSWAVAAGGAAPIQPHVEDLGVDPETGIHTVVEYRRNAAGKMEKVTRRTRIETRIVREYEVVASRARWARFGSAAVDNKGTTSKVDEVTIDRAGEDEKLQPVEAPVLISSAAGNSGTSAVVCSKCGGPHWSRMCTSEAGAGPGAGAAPAPAPGVYVPPHTAGFTSMSGVMPEQFNCTLRASNIDPSVPEDEVRAVFERFARGVFRGMPNFWMTKNHVPGCSNQVRDCGCDHIGRARVTYRDHDMAKAALEALDGHVGLGHLRWEVRWDEVRKTDPSKEGLAGSRHVSGYGQALPQNPTPGAGGRR